MSMKGKIVWAFRSGIHYEGSTLVSIHETLDGAYLAAQEFMERQDEKNRKVGAPVDEWEYEESEEGRYWEGEVFWLQIKPYEIQ